MKKIFFFCFFLFISLQCFSQDNPCDYKWTNWNTALMVGPDRVYFAYQTSKCGSSGMCGSPKVKMKHTFSYDATVTITLSGTNCDGEPIKMKFYSAEMPAGKEDLTSGNWHNFKNVREAIRVEVTYFKGKDYYKIIYDKEAGINQTTVNGKKVN